MVHLQVKYLYNTSCLYNECAMIKKKDYILALFFSFMN